jgi:integrase/recombinase XerD
MTLLAPTLQGWFTHRLASQKRASSHTVGAYRDTFRLLLGFVQHATGKHHRNWTSMTSTPT